MTLFNSTALDKGRKFLWYLLFNDTTFENLSLLQRTTTDLSAYVWVLKSKYSRSFVNFRRRFFFRQKLKCEKCSVHPPATRTDVLAVLRTYTPHTGVGGSKLNSLSTHEQFATFSKAMIIHTSRNVILTSSSMHHFLTVSNLQRSHLSKYCSEVHLFNEIFAVSSEWEHGIHSIDAQLNIGRKLLRSFASIPNLKVLLR
jgi:hypothetical protein